MSDRPKRHFVGFRATEKQTAKLRSLATQTGLTSADLMRFFIDSAETITVNEQRIVPVIRVDSFQRQAVQG